MLSVPRVPEAVAYYRDRLGFDVHLVYEDDSIPDYGVVSRDGFEVHLFEDLTRDVTEVRGGISATVDDVDAFFEELKDRGAFASDFPRHLDAIREHGPEDKHYGRRDMIFVDPNGYILVFGQPRD